jgi:hypothetical protein
VSSESITVRLTIVVLAIMDKNVFNVYGEKMKVYFEHHSLALTVHQTAIGEKAKTIPTLLEIVNAMTSFGIIRKVNKPLNVRQCLYICSPSSGTCLGSWRWSCYRCCWVSISIGYNSRTLTDNYSDLLVLPIDETRTSFAFQRLLLV